MPSCGSKTGGKRSGRWPNVTTGPSAIGNQPTTAGGRMLTIIRNQVDYQYQPLAKYGVSNRLTQINKKASSACAKLAPTHNKLRNLRRSLPSKRSKKSVGARLETASGPAAGDFGCGQGGEVLPHGHQRGEHPIAFTWR
jgi:hypothetical protein